MKHFDGCILLLLLAGILAIQCSSNSISSNDTSDTDSDGDTDSDSDTDGDSDGDGDTDGDSDGDSDGDTDSYGDADSEGGEDCDPTAPDALEVAVVRGDPRCVELQPVLDEAVLLVESARTWQCALTLGMYGQGPMEYAPGNGTQFPTPGYASTASILTGDAGNVLAIAGTVKNTSIAAFGSTPPKYFQDGINGTFEEPFIRLLEWLLTGDSASGIARDEIHRVGVAYMPGGELSDTTNWMAETVPNWVVTNCTSFGDLNSCFQGQELLVVGSSDNGDDIDTIVTALNAAITAGISIIYLHTASWGTNEFTDRISSILGFTLPYGGNWWADDSASWTGVSQSPAPGEIACYDSALVGGLNQLLDGLINGSFQVDWSQCENDTVCEDAPGMETFYPGAKRVKSIAQGFDSRAQDPFQSPDEYRFEKILILLGDKFREVIAYPMEKGVTSDTSFLSAFFADHALLNTRLINPAQTDLGTFSPSVAEDHPTVSSQLSVATRAVDFSTSAEVYALPGQTITATRTDNLESEVKVFVNMLRNGSSHIFGDAYDRPAFLWGKEIPLSAGSPVRITSPYGGIIFVWVEGNDSLSDITIEFDNVARHPIYTGPGTEEAFETALQSTLLGWAEIKTPALEVHSRLDLMQETVADVQWNGDVATLVNWTWTYLYQDVWGLAGFVGTDLEHSTTVSAFCADKGWDCANMGIHGMQYVQHANMDRALCGYGCSGNPYDAYWAFSPLGWGDAHEIGHNLQRGRLKIYDGASGEVSNNIFPVHYWWRFNGDGLGDQYGRELDFEGTYQLLQDAQNTADPSTDMYQTLWVDGSVFQRLIFYWQLAMVNADVIHLGDKGWDVFRLLYILERIFSRAVGNETDWLASRDNLGFSTYEYADAESLASENDFMLVAVSFITGKDHRPLFDMWGVSYSTKADEQVTALELTQATANEYWVIPDESAYSDPYDTPLPVDGTSAWPY